MKISNIQKLYASNFLTGMVFWYGIEKLFMQSIGINAVGIGAATASLTIFLVIFDIPSGIIADKWSRKGMLALSAISLTACSLVMGSSKGLGLYIVGELLYGLYVVATSGTYGALMYDTLHEENRAHLYSKINGRAYGLFLAGAGVGNIASGYIAHHFSYKYSFFLSVIPCLFNLVVIMSMYEPTFHKSLNKQKFLPQISKASIEIIKLQLLRVLTIVISLLAVAELFKLEFGQIYMLRYLSSPQAIGLLWAVFAFAMSLGSLIAHRFRTKLTSLVVLAAIPYILMAIIDNKFSLVLFMIQVIAAAALINQVETRIQENTRSSVRTSVLSVVSTLGRVISIPASFFIGWLIKNYSVLYAQRFTAVILSCMLVFWLLVGKRIPDADAPLLAE